MRQIGTLPDEQQAGRFRDYLLTLEIKGMVEQGTHGWDVWIHDEDHIGTAKEELARFAESPDESRYVEAFEKATQTRREAKQKNKKAKKNYVNVSREMHQSRSSGMGIPILLAANVMVYFLFQLPGGRNFIDQFDLSRDSILSTYEVWRLVTYGFLHSPKGYSHLLFNMYVLWLFGRMVEPIVGSKEFVVFYLLGVIASGTCHVLLESSHVVGASGGVMAVVFLAVMTYPRARIYFMLMIPMEFRFLAVLYVAADLAGIANDTPSNVAHAAHLAGAAFGAAYKYFGWRFTGRSRLF